MAKQTMKNWVCTVKVNGFADEVYEVAAATAYMANTKAMHRYQKKYAGRVVPGLKLDYRSKAVEKS